MINMQSLSLKKKIKSVFETSKNIETAVIFSDGCAAQFKNKYTLSNICFSENDFNLKIEWNFFATSHGKGAVDGIGGLTKRLVWNEVRSKKKVLNNAQDFFLCAKSKSTKIEMMYVDSTIIKDYKNFLDNRWNNIHSIPGVQSRHFFKKIDEKKLAVKRTSLSEKVEAIQIFL